MPAPAREEAGRLGAEEEEKRRPLGGWQGFTHLFPGGNGIIYAVVA